MGTTQANRSTLLLCLGLAACTADSPTRVGDAPLVGDWLARSYLVSPAGDASVSVDLVAEHGWFLQMSFRADGSHSAREVWPTGRFVQDGRWTITEAPNGTIDYGDGESYPFSYYSTPDGLVLLAPGEGWDFDGDGIDEPNVASVDLVPVSDSPAPEVVGSWTAVDYRLTSRVDPTRSVDVIAEGGSLRLTISGSRASFTDERPGVGTETGTAEFYAVARRMWFFVDNEYTPFAYRVEGSTMIMESDWDAYDFDGDGVLEPARIRTELVPD